MLQFSSSRTSDKYIEITRHGQQERLILRELIKRAPCVVGGATTCWRAYHEADVLQTPLVIKDACSWQYPEREQVGELLREATENEVVNLAYSPTSGAVLASNIPPTTPE